MDKLKTYKIKGMHCASCASIIEKTFKKTEGVNSVEVNYGTETARLSFDDKKTNLQDLSKKIEKFGYSLETPTTESMGMSESEHIAHLGITQSKQEKLFEIQDMKTKVLSAVPLAVISIFVMGWDILAQYNVVPMMGPAIKEFLSYLLPMMATYILFVVGKPYLLGFLRFLTLQLH